ncbi:hypothetical protein BACPEC_02315 [[Bacteroides] pectinophilus ATCC 43243]|uniref:Uncharacterized protein n=1 Tax=[Bacteroides] pectinophilus ATCC 43243 TaxID=483218 RepID=B7AUB7_9FIRM|nr:hypothetical protein BACPEC_02315 [[Bacteroides] pectinophilus ATCC 43243]
MYIIIYIIANCFCFVNETGLLAQKVQKTPAVISDRRSFYI